MFLLIVLLVKRFKVFLSGRLPQPILGEGSNVEWAEEVISEISNGHGHRGLTIDTPSELVAVRSRTADTGPLRRTYDRLDYAVAVKSEPSNSVTDQSRAEL